MRDQELVLSQLNSLRDMGCSIALDDFGTGYSSLGYLWQFPFSKLKIDRSFIHALDTTPKAPSILKSIIDLSRNLGISTGALPFTALFDRRGAVVQRKLGETSFDELIAWAQKL